jgi:tetratricopeptide (TPR) repeat protein/class 3 adenylate cyclase
MKTIFIALMIVALASMILTDNYAQKQKPRKVQTIKEEEKPKTIQVQIDSLETELSTAIEDTNKVNILNDIAGKKYSYAPDECIKLGEQALALSDTLQWQKGKADALRMIGIGYAVKSDNEKALSFFEQSLKIFEEINDKKGISSAVASIGNVYLYLSNYPKALEYDEKALKIAEEIGDKNSIRRHLVGIGGVYFHLSNYLKALEYYEKNLNISEEIGDKNSLGIDLGNIGSVHLAISNYPKALEYFEKALKIAEEIGDKKSIGSHLGNIGGVYFLLSNYPKSLEYYEKALKIAKEIGDKNVIGSCLGNIGNVYYSLSDYPKSLEYYEKALKLAEEIGNKGNIGNHLSNIGIVYRAISNYPKALEYYEKALKIAEEIGNKHSIAGNLSNIGELYYELKEYKQALGYYERALKISEETGNKNFLLRHLEGIGNIYSALNNYSKALEYYEKSLKIADEIGDKSSQYRNKLSIGNLHLNIALDTLKPASDSPKKENLLLALSYTQTALNGFKEIKEEDQQRECEDQLSKIYEAMGDYKSSLSSFKNAQILKDSIFSGENLKKIAEITAKKDLEIKEKENELLKQNAALNESELERRNQELANLGNLQKIQKLELDKKNLDILSKNNELSLLSKDKELQTIEIKQKDIEAQKNSNDIELLNKENQYQGAVRNFLYIGIGLISSLAIVLFLFFWRKKRDNKQLEEKNVQITQQKEIIEKEQEKSDKLLLNVLPPAIATRLKNGETTIADHYEEASIVFIDVVEFTKSSQGVEPKRVVEVLNELYTKLDSIAQKHGLEKIKTIGDCYMAAAGVPEIRKDNAKMAAKFAIEAMQAIKDYDTGDGVLINFRCGIDCGPVVAGVIGEKKFIYDIWGDAVNTASRMEVYGEAGRIHVTERFQEKLGIRNEELGIKFEERGEIDIKGKGMMRTYFLKNNSY